MKIASWNVNGIRARLDHVSQWLQTNQPDVLALQETKVMDEMFPLDVFKPLGYQASIYGQKSYNGVAFLTKKSPTGLTKGIEGFTDDQTRVIAGIFSGVLIINVYVPNGQSVGSEKFDYKMRWLNHFYIHLQTLLKTHQKIVILGDFNIAPDDMDVHDPELWKDKVLCSENERRWLNKILGLGFSDSFRLFEQQEGLYSWWDYRAAAYRRKMGMRIDLVLVSEALKTGCAKSYIDEGPRGQDRPSDHTPAVIELN